jgi:hypothetical protein
MRDLEQQLRNAFVRQEPPEGFADRVMERIPASRSGWQRRWMAVAAAACVAVVGGASWEQHRRENEGERAKQELIYALTIASESLQMTKQIITR